MAALAHTTAVAATLAISNASEGASYYAIKKIKQVAQYVSRSLSKVAPVINANIVVESNLEISQDNVVMDIVPGHDDKERPKVSTTNDRRTLAPLIRTDDIPYLPGVQMEESKTLVPKTATTPKQARELVTIKIKHGMDHNQ